MAAGYDWVTYLPVKTKTGERGLIARQRANSIFIGHSIAGEILMAKYS